MRVPSERFQADEMCHNLDKNLIIKMLLGKEKKGFGCMVKSRALSISRVEEGFI